MKKILILTGRYLPGFKDGGPVRSIVNLVDCFGDKYEIKIMCTDRDHGDTESYPDISVYDWNDVRGAKVFYVPPKGYALSLIKRLADDADIVYCCGPYNDYAISAMLLNRMGLIRCPFVVASMGSFSPEAYAIKGGKKRLFVAVMKMLGFFRKVTWSVTSKREEDELKAVIGQKAKTIIAEDLPRKGIIAHDHKKEESSLKVIFLSRISRKKNLLKAVQALNGISGNLNITFDIYGNMEDPDYYSECEAVLKELPENIKWEYKGLADSDEVPGIWAKYDVFLFPTMGENYGHVIAEAMSGGCVPVISDQTPWMDLNENGCGCVIPLEKTEEFTKALEALASLSSAEMEKMAANAQDYIRRHNEESINNSGYLKIFEM